jgi:hypothetical protein
LIDDREVLEALRDKLVAELLGASPHQPKAKEKGERSQRPNIQSQVEKMKQTIQLADKYKELLGANESIWSKMVQNPEFMKMAMGLIQGLMGSFGLPQATAAADGNGQRYFVLIDNRYVEMDHNAFRQYISKKKVLESPPVTPIQPDQKQPTDKPVAAKGNPKPWPPPVAPPVKIPEPGKEKAQEVDSQPTAVQQNDAEASRVCVAKIIEAMDKPVEEFVKKTVASCQSGDKESLQIKDFLLAHKWGDILKELSPDCGYVERIEKNRKWFDHVTEALRTQL